ncbi:YceI family protein [Deinococcus cellulosilyticus]|uniref:Lipid/polyisoprenoid-binding YceI-like domain-containing protein n=1 Tax=Deinococcus cellulosilyticus (strain DSM 18568 / NBRC 106333 / KACC 11606 / 5516J-15) TaxID=1223518 RepID=A0A511NB24_DEIC1|nr:YceI family protein [Deinococcus cellulosilyticus]GEM49728.1 hypothetical protein DC3_53630 [Deinococcus cellulosilyticus NBRC 106333 = KACC 11606]
MKWNIDPSHSQIGFAVKHMMISTVRGSFKSFQGTIETDDQYRPVNVQVTIDADSVDTRDAQRDGHLRSADFFNADSSRQLVFQSTSVEQTGEQQYSIKGDLTINGITRQVTLKAETTSTGKDPWGNTRIAAEATATINREDWNITWNQALEFGGVLVGKEVKLHLEVQAIQVQDTVLS